MIPSARKRCTAPSAIAFGRQQVPTFVYKGLENVALVQTFAIENLDDEGSFTAFDGHVTAFLSSRDFLHFGLNTYGLDLKGSQETIDPLGQDLRFPGVTTPGFSLGAFVPEGTPGGLNVVENERYAYDADTTTLYAAYARAWATGNVEFIGYAGLAYTWMNQRQSMTGNIPGYAIDYRYDTSIDTDAVRGMLGTRLTYAFEDAPRLRLNAGATAFLNWVDAEGTDHLDLGALSQSLDIGRSDTTFSWSAGVGAEIDVAAVTFYLNYRHIEDDITPVVVRHDDGPSRIEFDTSAADIIMVGARIKF